MRLEKVRDRFIQTLPVLLCLPFVDGVLGSAATGLPPLTVQVYQLPDGKYYYATSRAEQLRLSRLSRVSVEPTLSTGPVTHDQHLPDAVAAALSLYTDGRETAHGYSANDAKPALAVAPIAPVSAAQETIRQQALGMSLTLQPSRYLGNQNTLTPIAGTRDTVTPPLSKPPLRQALKPVKPATITARRVIDPRLYLSSSSLAESRFISELTGSVERFIGLPPSPGQSKHSSNTMAPWELARAYRFARTAQNSAMPDDATPDTTRFAGVDTSLAFAAHPSAGIVALVSDELHLAKPGLTILLDPGHGGSDPGTIGPDGLTEKEITLDVANRVQEILHQRGDIEIKLSRFDDEGMARGVRIARIYQARPDAVVSLHFNHLPNPRITLVESFYAGKESIRQSVLQTGSAGLYATSGGEMFGRHADKSRHLATLLQEEVFPVVKGGAPRAIDAGVKPNNLYMLTRSNLPAALIELTCLSNTEEEQRLRGDEYRQQLAEALVRSLRAYAEFEHAPNV